jgi:hypothetical protein
VPKKKSGDHNVLYWIFNFSLALKVSPACSIQKLVSLGLVFSSFFFLFDDWITYLFSNSHSRAIGRAVATDASKLFDCKE